MIVAFIFSESPSIARRWLAVEDRTQTWNWEAACPLFDHQRSLRPFVRQSPLNQMVNLLLSVNFHQDGDPSSGHYGDIRWREVESNLSNPPQHRGFPALNRGRLRIKIFSYIIKEKRCYLHHSGVLFNETLSTLTPTGYQPVWNSIQIN